MREKNGHFTACKSQTAVIAVERAIRAMRRVWFQSQSAASQAEKRQRSFDKVVDEWKRKVADLQAELEGSQRDSRTHAAEVYKLRAQLEEAQDGSESLRREAKNLQGLSKKYQSFVSYALSRYQT